MTKCETIIEKVSMRDLLDHYGIRKGRGNSYYCPFHDDKHPSASIHPSKNIFRCWVDNKSYNVLTFVQEYEKCDCKTAISVIDGIFNLGLNSLLSEKEKAELDRKKAVSAHNKKLKAEQDRKDRVAVNKILTNLKFWEDVKLLSKTTRIKAKVGLWEREKEFWFSLKQVDFYEWVYAELIGEKQDICIWDSCELANLTREQLVDRIINDKREIFI